MVSGSESPVGVLLFEQAGERREGDPGLPGSFPFPVRLGLVSGSYRELIQGSPAVCNRLCQAARRLAEEGVGSIVGDCGLMALYQREIAEAAGVPAVSSSLILLPLLRQMIGQSRSIGILTGHSRLLSYAHLISAGASSLDGLVIQGMENEPHFRQVVIEGQGHHEYEAMRRDVLHAAEQVLARGKPVGALLLECSNLSTYAWELSQAFSLPVFDIGTAVWLLRHATAKTCYRPL